FLTGFSVAWGIMMLVVLLAAGQGLQNGAMSEFLSDATNSLWVNGGRTSVAYKGYNSNRPIILDNTDYNQIVTGNNDLEETSGSKNFWGAEVVWGKEAANYEVRCVHPEHQRLERNNMVAGRYINQRD